MMMRRDEGEEKSEVQRCELGSGRRPSRARAGPASATWENLLDEVSLQNSQPLANGSTFSCENTISQYFHYGPSSTPPTPSSAFPQKPQL